jgi:D-threonine aldolase
MNTDNKWFTIENVETIDSPALIFYKDRIAENIRQLKKRVPNVGRLRPHVKTNKSADICAMMIGDGITKFKCATIAEAEMLSVINAPDVLLAYQPVGPKIKRLFELVRKYPSTKFSCLVDNTDSGKEIALLFHSNGQNINVFIDLNVGMHRTGITPEKSIALFEELHSIAGITIIGLHMYDGHITDADIDLRRQRCNAEYEKVFSLRDLIERKYHRDLTIVGGGSPTFSVHAEQNDVECSPGTFVLWDWSYKHSYPDEPYEYGALVITRVISITSATTMTIDLGHKSVAAENPLPRVHFLNAPEATPIGHSEEHMVLKVADTKKYKSGDVLYGIPVHICPTVALYEHATVVQDQKIMTEWNITARNKRITI